jgi:hypothetical protein
MNEHNGAQWNAGRRGGNTRKGNVQNGNKEGIEGNGSIRLGKQLQKQPKEMIV